MFRLTHIFRKVLDYYDLESCEVEEELDPEYKVFENIEFDWSYSFDQENEENKTPPKRKWRRT